MLLSDFSDALLQLSATVKDYESALQDPNPDPTDLLTMQCRIDDAITSFTIFFQKCPKLQSTFEAIREYYIREILKKQKG